MLLLLSIFADANRLKDLKQGNKMTKKDLFDRIEYVVACVGAFAQRHKLSNAQSYAYLRRYSGIDFLLDCYGAEHTLSIDDAISDLKVICNREGGKI